MNKEQLEDYYQKETAQVEIFLKEIKEKGLDISSYKYPRDNRFVNLHEPVAFTTPETGSSENLWATIPFSGSTLIMLAPVPLPVFEKKYFKAADFQKIINFIKETGKLQIGLSPELNLYEGLDYLDPFFTELNPPALYGLPMSMMGHSEDASEAYETFDTLAGIRFYNYIDDDIGKVVTHSLLNSIKHIDRQTYVFLKLSGFSSIINEIENSMVDEPDKAFYLFHIYNQFIVTPSCDMRSNLRNYSLKEIKEARGLPNFTNLNELNLPCEIGKFLMRDKLTYAPLSLEACIDVIFHYKDYDLQKVAESLNDGIALNQPEVISKSMEEFTQILDNIWNDRTIPNKIKAIEIGVPLSIAALGGGIAGLPGLFAGGFLSELGFKVFENVSEKCAEKLFDEKNSTIIDRLAKIGTKSYQANIYDFRKKYNTK